MAIVLSKSDHVPLWRGQGEEAITITTLIKLSTWKIQTTTNYSTSF